MDNPLRGTHTTFTTSLLQPLPSAAAPFSADTQAKIQALLASQGSPYVVSDHVQMQRTDSTVNGVVIGLLSSFGSALLIAFVALIVYFFRYTSSGRILLDRIGRPGEYDDEQAYAREEAEALEEMDDLQRMEYLRAKGTSYLYIDVCGFDVEIEANHDHSIYTSKSARFITNRHLTFTIPSDSGEGCIGMGV